MPPKHRLPAFPKVIGQDLVRVGELAFKPFLDNGEDRVRDVVGVRAKPGFGLGPPGLKPWARSAASWVGGNGFFLDISQSLTFAWYYAGNREAKGSPYVKG